MSDSVSASDYVELIAEAIHGGSEVKVRLAGDENWIHVKSVDFHGGLIQLEIAFEKDLFVPPSSVLAVLVAEIADLDTDLDESISGR